MDLFISECFNSIKHVETENSKFTIDLFQNEYQYATGKDVVSIYQ
jgi:hypothetical protein